MWKLVPSVNNESGIVLVDWRSENRVEGTGWDMGGRTVNHRYGTVHLFTPLSFHL